MTTDRVTTKCRAIIAYTIARDTSETMLHSVPQSVVAEWLAHTRGSFPEAVHEVLLYLLLHINGIAYV